MSGETTENIIEFRGSDTLAEEVILSISANGEIYYKGRLLTTDKEIVDGLKSLILNYTCPKCKEGL